MLKLNLYTACDDSNKIYSMSQLLPIIIGYNIAHYIGRPHTTLTQAIMHMLHINIASYQTDNLSKLNLIPEESYSKATQIALSAYVQFVKGTDDIDFDITDFDLKPIKEYLSLVVDSGFPTPSIVKNQSGDTIILTLSPEDILAYLEYYNLLLDPCDHYIQNHITIPIEPYTGPQFVKRLLSGHVRNIPMTILDSPLAKIIYES